MEPHPSRLTAFLDRNLNRLERFGNRLPHPLTLFVLLALAVPPISALLYHLGTVAIHPRTGETVAVVNLLSSDGIVRMLTNGLSNFTGFAPLGTVLVAMLGIGVAERSGAVSALLRVIVLSAGKRWITPALVLAGVMSSLAADVGYVILPPLGALVFLAIGRHPFAGLCAVLAGVSGGFSANLLITVLDPMLAGITNEAARIYDPNYVVTPLANYYFMVASTLMLVPIGWLVTEKIVEPRLGKWNAPGLAGVVADATEDTGGDTATESNPVASTALLPEEKRGLIAAAICMVGCAVIAAWLIFPEGAWLREPDGPLGGFQPFFQSMVILIALMLFLPGLVYGIISRSIRSDKDVAQMMGDSMATMGIYIVLAFAAAQFIAWFDWSNMGLVLAIKGASGLRQLNLGGLPLLFGIMIVAGTINLFIGSASAKWAILAVVLVPMMMDLGFSPELTQAAFRVGDSVTNIITPISPYFPLILAFAQKYDRSIGLGSIIAAMLPYSVFFAIGWAALMTVWFLFGWPLGPAAPIFYTF